jgi:hypothetical protein
MIYVFETFPIEKETAKPAKERRVRQALAVFFVRTMENSKWQITSGKFMANGKCI